MAIISNTSATPLLEVENLVTWFPIKRGVLSRTVGYVRAVDGVTFSIAKGESLGLVGESGCGKTTLGRTIVGLEKPKGGDIRFKGTSLLQQSRQGMREFRRYLQIVFQDPLSALNPKMTILDILTEGLQEFNLIKHSRASHASELLNEVGLEQGALFRYPHEFSGGQRQRINIARAISLKPQFIVCDEAVSALDVSVQAQIINLLMDLKEKYELSYLFISHDLSIVHHIADRVAVMYLGRIVEQGDSAAVIHRPKHPYTQALLSAVPAIGKTNSAKGVIQGEAPSPSAPPPGCRFHPRCPEMMDICRQKDPSLTMQDHHQVYCHLYG
jgi:oligopeptide/dipeptide ABC transporter ATP-binding protein